MTHLLQTAAVVIVTESHLQALPSATWNRDYSIECQECGDLCDDDWFDPVPHAGPVGRWLRLGDGKVFHMHGYTSFHPTQIAEEEA
jgi:hypothetical protein